MTLWILVLILCSAPRSAAAQGLEDTLLTDTLEVDTVDITARYLKALEQEEVRVPVLQALAPPGPRPALTRLVFTRDSMEWLSGATVGDVLAQVPGVYVWRGGYVGRPEPVDFQGRGGTSAEYYVDGVPYVATGVDSVAVDPALFSMSFLDRVEVERWPGQIRVYLFTRRQDRLAPRTRIAIARGDRNFARYEASIERRFPSGVGFALAADYLSSPTASGASSGYSNTQVFGQGGWIPSPRFGIQYQLLRSHPKRRPFTIADVALTDTIGLGFNATRTDAQIRLALRSRGDGTGTGLDVIYARSAWDGAGLDQQNNQIGGVLSYRASTFSAGASGFHRTRWTPLDLRGTFGWSPLTAFAASAEAVLQHHFGGRSSKYVTLAAGLHPLRGLALTGTARLGDLVAAPSILADTAQKLRDFEAQLGWSRPRLGLQVGYARTSAFNPFGYAEFFEIAGLAPTPETNWLTVTGRVSPVGWITIQSWYSDPLDGTPVDGVPPTHSLTTATIRSKFLRRFSSGIFDLKLQVGMEAWGRGTIGRDASGAPITLRGATFFKSLVEFQLQSFTVYWDRGNLSATDLTYVPGFTQPSFVSNFGVRWEFWN